MKQPGSFPTTHKLHPAPPGLFLSPEGSKLVREADLIIAFDWVDLAGFFTAANASEPNAKTVEVTLDTMLHNGWSKDHFETAPVDISIVADPDKFITDLVEHLSSSKLQGFPSSSWPVMEPSSSLKELKFDGEDIFQGDLASGLYATLKPEEMCIIRLPLSFRGIDLLATHPLAYLGMDGGAGIGSGPGQAVGSALALKGSSLIPVAILGDGDYLMGCSALWTAARYKIPVLVIVANNASFFNDEVHQERVANARGRPVENKWIGMRLDDPLPDIGKISEGLGMKVLGGQVTKRSALKSTLEEAVKRVKEGKESIVVDIRVMPYDYQSTWDPNSIKAGPKKK
jgi:thiamine pyrophosphate-dependent acetolactate synthase large subunit-like protein